MINLILLIFHILALFFAVYVLIKLQMRCGMTKRFENVEIDKRYCLICLNDNIRFRSLSEEGLEDLLNELNDENEQLKQTCQMVEDTYHSLQKKFHNWDIALSKCREENEQLKEAIKDLNDVLARYEEKELEE